MTSSPTLPGGPTVVVAPRVVDEATVGAIVDATELDAVDGLDAVDDELTDEVELAPGREVVVMRPVVVELTVSESEVLVATTVAFVDDEPVDAVDDEPVDAVDDEPLDAVDDEPLVAVDAEALPVEPEIVVVGRSAAPLPSTVEPGREVAAALPVTEPVRLVAGALENGEPDEPDDCEGTDVVAAGGLRDDLGVRRTPSVGAANGLPELRFTTTGSTRRTDEPAPVALSTTKVARGVIAGAA